MAAIDVSESVRLSIRHGALLGRGFILFLTGFLGGAMTSVLPPLATIFSAADLEK